MVRQDEMTNSEIFQLLSEYKFKDSEMKDIVNMLPARDFESVLNYIEELRTSTGNWKDDDRERMIEEFKKRNDLQRMEAERVERQRTIIKEKIAANRKELQEKERLEIKAVEIDDIPAQIDSEIKVRLYIPNDESEMYFGFKKEATIKDLYEKLASKIGNSNFRISRFAHDTPIEVSNKFIFEEFKANAIMIEIISSK